MMRLTCCLTVFAVSAYAASPDVTPIAHVETSVRVDPAHPIKLGENYPELSKKNREEGLTVVRVEVDTDGVIRASQVVASSGFPRLDYACLEAITGARAIPATVDGKPIDTWVNIPTAWNLNKSGHFRPHRLDDTEIQIPIIQKNYRLEVGPQDYPSASLANNQQGDCTIRALIGEDGTVSEVNVIKSTGFATLDQACVKAIKHAPFLPARQNGQAIDAPATINIRWRLPERSGD